MMVDPKYFDYAASSPPWTEAIEAFAETSKVAYANPSSIHQYGRSAKELMFQLKKEFYDLLNFSDGRLMLASSGSEANNTIIEGHLSKYPEGKILMAADVHDSIWYAYKKYLKRVDLFNLQTDGHYDLSKFESALKKDITLVCINHACNETGAIQPAGEIAEICHQNNVKLLIDGMQSIGHIPINLDQIPFTYYTISGHKFGGVKGAAGVLMRDDQFEPLIGGGKQEWEKRAGTENIAALASMVSALKKSLEIMDGENARLIELKNLMIQSIESIPVAIVNTVSPDLPSLLSVSFPGFSGREIVGALAMSGYAVSTGSACHANEMEPSRIIRSMGRTSREAISTIRISMGFGTTEESVHGLLGKLFDLVK